MNDLTSFDFSAFADCDADTGLRLGSAASRRLSQGLLHMQELIDHAGSDLQAVMDAVVTSALEVMPQATAAGVALRDGGGLVYRAVSGLPKDRLGQPLEFGGTFALRAMREGRALRCDNSLQDERLDGAACHAAGHGSILVVPLPHRGETIGVLKIYSGSAHAFSDADLLTAQLLAGPLAIGFASVTEATALAERALADRRFTATFEQAAVGIAHVSPTGRFLMVNRKFCEIAGFTRKQLLNATFQDITYAEDLDVDLGYLKSLVAGDIDSYALEKRYVRRDGSPHWIMLTVSLIRDEAGEPDFFVAVIEDINARKQAELDSLHDPLTGLLNRRGAMMRLERELGRSALSGEPITVAFLDLDGFKALNDTRGHAEGDRCLIETGRALTDICRPGDVVARLGGDEFLILLPGLADDAAPAALDRLLNAIRGCCTNIRGSIGAVTLEGGKASAPEQVVIAADRLMYQAKRDGRDRVVLGRWTGLGDTRR
jgi:diguanylate cyclase (GGDEF)-like protein/PAS domain S-box-containing protein